MTIQRSTKDMVMTTIQPKHASRRIASRLSLLVALAVTALPLAAQAQRKSPLADAPAVRKRFELRQTRFEIGAGFGSTVNQDFYHTMLANVKVGFHLTDWLAISAFGDFGVANIGTGFRGTLVDAPPAGSLPDTPQAGHYAPTRAEAMASMQQISNILGGQLELSPFTGKYSLFGKLFASYDFYGFVGGGGITVKPTNANGLVSCDNAPAGTTSCKVEGFQPGAIFGLGFHSFFNNFLALDVSLRDVLAKLNPAGRDVNGDLTADAKDMTWTHTIVVTASLVLYFPTRPGVSF
jgi:outer membrane beta-barrel protein